MDPADKVALVTGASRGIGKATAIALAERGAKLLLVARNESDLEAVAAACREAGSPRVLVVAVDLATYDGLDHVVMSAVREFDGFDILVNNAGIGQIEPITDVADETFDHTIAVNLRAPFMLTQAAVKTMRRRAGGQIVQIGSGLSYWGRADWSTYTATKFALRGFTECVRQEVAGDGIKIALVSPGYTETHFFDDIDQDPGFPAGLDVESVVHAIITVITQPARSDIKDLQVRPMGG